MGLSTKREQMLKAMPIIRNEIRKSKDGRFVIHKTVITEIKPTAYWEAVLANDAREVSAEDEIQELLDAVEV